MLKNDKHAIHRVFTNREDIPEDLRMDFAYLENHEIACQNSEKTNDDYSTLAPKNLQKPMEFKPIAEPPIFSACGAPNVHVDADGRFFHTSVPNSVTHCSELKYHPLCCYIKSKIHSGNSTIAIKEDLRELQAKYILQTSQPIEHKLQAIFIRELTRRRRLILKYAPLEFIIGKMNQVECPIWEHLSSEILFELKTRL